MIKWKSLFITIFTILMFSDEFLSTQPPNIIFMLIDDLGWNDISFHGSMQIPTPNIDSLAYSGVILNKYYVQPLCTPSRGSLMTGKYPIKLGLQHYVIVATEPWGLSPEEKILPQYLKELGYSTHGVGKWHLGYFQNDYLPTNRGFDSFFGYWNGKNDFFTHFQECNGHYGLDLHEGAENAWNYTGYYATEAFTERAKRIIKNHDSSKPLFLYLSHQAVHAGNDYSPLQAPLEYFKKFSHIKDQERRAFAGIVSALDKSIGEIFSALDETHMLNNSIIIFSTDNGGAVEGIDMSTGSNWPLRGSKYNMWEGGIRGAAFVWSPLLRQKKARVSESLMHISDWLPTLYSVAGGDIKKLGPIDGYNLWPSISQTIPSPRDHILINIDPDWKVEAIRKDNYKLLKGSVFDGKFDGWFDKEGKKKDDTPFDEEYLMIQKKFYQNELSKSEVARILSRCSGCLSSDYHGEIAYSPDHCKRDNPETGNCNIDEGPDFHDYSIKVNCGMKPKNASSNCQPMKEACLFNIDSDPCEYNNLAKELPMVVKELEELLDRYRKEAVPIRNLPEDPLANPKYHGYAWVPWVEGKHKHRL